MKAYYFFLVAVLVGLMGCVKRVTPRQFVEYYCRCHIRYITYGDNDMANDTCRKLSAKRFKIYNTYYKIVFQRGGDTIDKKEYDEAFEFMLLVGDNYHYCDSIDDNMNAEMLNELMLSPDYE